MKPSMKTFSSLAIVYSWIQFGICRDEDRILKACYWPNEVYEPCFGGCAEVTCDNPRNHLRPCYPYCEPGCICEDPYVRDDRTHQCVLPQDCSPTQMGIPVPSKRSDKSPLPPPAQSPSFKYSSRDGRSGRGHAKREEFPADYNENDSPINNKVDEAKESKRTSEVSRMGNYFNIVIAPPPIKALQPRKLLQNDAFRAPMKRM